MSTDSGIPDYRGPGSVVRTPMTYQDFVASPEAQQRYWARAHVGWSRMVRAEPNPTHRILAELEAAGGLTGLITQNVDGLHSRAGHRELIELHGRIDRVVCLDCRVTSRRIDLHTRLEALNPAFAARDARLAPDGDVLLEETADFVVAPCLDCGGRLKPDVVFFGENVPKARVTRSFELVDRAGLLLVLGSSLHVMSGLRFVKAAARREIPIVVVNRGPTRGDDLATMKIDGGCAETLREILRPPFHPVPLETDSVLA